MILVTPSAKIEGKKGLNSCVKMKRTKNIQSSMLQKLALPNVTSQAAETGICTFIKTFHVYVVASDKNVSSLN